MYSPRRALLSALFAIASLILFSSVASAQAFERVVKLKPGRAEAHYNLGLLYHRLGRAEDVRAKSRMLHELKKKDLADKLETLLAG